MRRQGPLNEVYYRGHSQQDTGKDLFALLFLVMLMLAQIFMILAHDAVSDKSESLIENTGKGSDTQIPEKPPVGLVFQRGGNIILKFDDREFDPGKDGSKLVTSGYTVTGRDDQGREIQVLYINYEGIIDSKALSRGLAPLQGIGIVPLLHD